jgi:drug/metabolite transporter (DMT)-like permease
MTVFMALMIIATRRSRGAPALPIAALSSLASSLLAAPLAHLGAPSGAQLAELALFGAGQLGLGLLLLTAGSRRLSASRVALIGGLDVPLAPIWVWLAFDETPTAATIAGGLAVIAAVVLNTLWSTPARQPTPVPGGIATATDVE